MAGGAGAPPTHDSCSIPFFTETNPTVMEEMRRYDKKAKWIHPD